MVDWQYAERSCGSRGSLWEGLSENLLGPLAMESKFNNRTRLIHADVHNIKCSTQLGH